VRQANNALAAGTRWRLIKEVCLVLVLAAAYEEISAHMVQASGAASRHALLIVSVERSLGLFHERAVQAAVLGSGGGTATDVFNLYYGGTHFLVPAIVRGRRRPPPVRHHQHRTHPP
jgi:hypothetical protein